jgi:NADPH-dependent ferric siderophore reductase
VTNAQAGQRRARSRYRLLEVRGTEWITPRMVRVVLGGEELADFVSNGSDQRIKLCLAQPGQPMPLGRTRAEVFALPREQQPRQRTYTVRRFDGQLLELAIDFVVHDHEGPGSRWATGARAGDRIVTVGPSMAYEPQSDADPLVLVGDETALPAMSSILEELPAGARVEVFAEIADAAEQQQQVASAAEVTWHWLHRDGTPAGESDLLPTAIRGADLGPDPHLWIGAEADTVHALREHCQRALGLDRRRLYALNYWRKGTTG